MIRPPISKLHVSVAVGTALTLSISLLTPPAQCAPQLIAQYSSSDESAKTESSLEDDKKPTTSTSDTSSTEDSPAVIDAKRSAAKQLQHQLQYQRDQQFMRLLLIGIFIFFAAIAFAGYLSIPRRKKEGEATEETSNAD